MRTHRRIDRFQCSQGENQLESGMNCAQNIQHIILKLCDSNGFFVCIFLSLCLTAWWQHHQPEAFGQIKHSRAKPHQPRLEHQLTTVTGIVVKSHNFHNSLPSYFTLCVIQLVWFQPYSPYVYLFFQWHFEFVAVFFLFLFFTFIIFFPLCSVCFHFEPLFSIDLYYLFAWIGFYVTFPLYRLCPVLRNHFRN